MEQHFRNYHRNHQIQENEREIIVGNWEKEKRKTKKFPKASRVDETESSEQSEQAKPEQCKLKTCIYQETNDQELYLKILLPYLNNLSEEVTSESTQVKEPHEK